MNMTARLIAAAGAGEVLVSNGFYQALPASDRAAFAPMDLVDRRNVGLIRCWRRAPHP